MLLRVQSIEMYSSSELAPGTLGSVVPSTMIVVNISWLKAAQIGICVALQLMPLPTEALPISEADHQGLTDDGRAGAYEPNNLASHPLAKLVQLVLPSGR